MRMVSHSANIFQAASRPSSDSWEPRADVYMSRMRASLVSPYCEHSRSRTCTFLLNTHSTPRCVFSWYSWTIMRDTWWSRDSMMGFLIPDSIEVCFNLPPTTRRPSNIRRHNLNMGLDLCTRPQLRNDVSSAPNIWHCTWFKTIFSAADISATVIGPVGRVRFIKRDFNRSNQHTAFLRR